MKLIKETFRPVRVGAVRITCQEKNVKYVYETTTKAEAYIIGDLCISQTRRTYGIRRKAKAATAPQSPANISQEAQAAA